VEIAAIVVWQVADTAKATYAVDNYQDFVRVQAESALRRVATHPYGDAGGAGSPRTTWLSSMRNARPAW
jgi:regulator of protease activity HflC (stomatin/prohibitin superfamily)